MSKWENFLLLIFFVVSSCKTLPNKLQVEKVLVLEDFPSGSSLEYHNNKLYLVGDDAAKLMILDTSFHMIDSITLFESKVKRIPKAAKADLEASAIVTLNGQPHILLVGSASLPTREKVLFFPLDTLHLQEASTGSFVKRLSSTGIVEVNIEGATSIRNILVLANRGNLSNPHNHLVFTAPDFWLHPGSASVNIAVLKMAGNREFAGVSGLAYNEKDDLLLFTASSEATANSFEDGKIGDSYIGWVKNISHKTSNAEIVADGFINLTNSDKIFLGQKIESICISQSKNSNYNIHLVSDNDNGISKLFTIKMTIE